MPNTVEATLLQPKESPSRETGPYRADGPGAALCPSVRRLVLTDFRNYTTASLEPAGRPVVLVGPNGAGKTNMIEAVSLLTPGRGLRRARLGDIGRRGAGQGPDMPAARWAVASTVETVDGPVEIGTGLDPAAPADATERRVVRVDGATRRGQAALADRIAAVWLTPQMDRLFLEGPSGRRRFLDRLVFSLDPAHSGRVTAYEQAMRERGRLLRQAAESGWKQADSRWLDAVEEQMAGRAVAIAAARRDLVGQLSGLLDETGDLVDFPDAFPKPLLSISGDLEAGLATASALTAEDSFRESLGAGRRADAENGGATATGPHRSDLCVRHGGKGLSAADCSTGEQKGLLISIVLANARLLASLRGTPPILLLDEVAAHLDAGRREALFTALLATGAQFWITGTERDLFRPLDRHVRMFDVSDGRVAPVT